MAEEQKEIKLEKILSSALEQKASDIHLKVGYKPVIRVEGKLKDEDTEKLLDKENIMSIIKSILGDKKYNLFIEKKNWDLSYEARDGSGKTYRFRVNTAFDRNGPFVAMRIIPDNIRDITKVGFPNDVWKDIISLNQGLVLVTGVTGSGKTTTLASLIQEINKTRADHIITVEDPVEYIYKPSNCIISQRELGTDVKSFADGVKYSLREDPDILLIGEIRDKETALTALEASETGHLVFSTLHTKDVSGTVSRYIDLCESEDHENIRNSLANNLAYVLCQQLIPYGRRGIERTLAMEVMNAQSNIAIKNHIRKGEYYRIINELQTGKVHKMITMDSCLEQLYNSENIKKEQAIFHASDPEAMRQKLK